MKTVACGPSAYRAPACPLHLNHGSAFVAGTAAAGWLAARAVGRVAPRLARLVAAPEPGAAGPARDPRAAGRGAAVPGRDRHRVLVPAGRGDGPRAGGGEARRRIRAAAPAAAPARAPGAADAARARRVEPGRR